MMWADETAVQIVPETNYPLPPDAIWPDTSIEWRLFNGAIERDRSGNWWLTLRTPELSDIARVRIEDAQAFQSLEQLAEVRQRMGEDQ